VPAAADLLQYHRTATADSDIFVVRYERTEPNNTIA